MFAPLYRIELVREKSVSYEGTRLLNARNVEHFLRKKLNLHNQTEEILVALALDTKNQIIGIHEVSRGSLNSSIVHPKEIFKRLLINNANSFIIAHNHPSGNTEPSQEDIYITKRLKEAGELLGINLLDHIIIGEYSRYSIMMKD